MFQNFTEKMKIYGSSLKTNANHHSEVSSINHKLEDLQIPLDEAYCTLGRMYFESCGEETPEEYAQLFQMIRETLVQIEEQKQKLETVHSTYDDKKRELELQRAAIREREKEEAARRREEAAQRKEEAARLKEEAKAQAAAEDAAEMSDVSAPAAESADRASASAAESADSVSAESKVEMTAVSAKPAAPQDAESSSAQDVSGQNGDFDAAAKVQQDVVEET